MHAAVSFRCRRIALLQEGPHRRQSGKESAVRSARGCRLTWAGVDYSVYTPGRTCWVVVLELVLRQKGSRMRISGRKHVIGGLLIGFAILGAVPRSAAQQAITPTAKELNKAFDADTSQWTARFEHEGRAIYDKRYEIVDAMHLKPGMNAADIGAGSGLFARLMAQRVAPGGTVYAVDISKNMIDYITKMATQEKIANVKSVLGDP